MTLIFDNLLTEGTIYTVCVVLIRGEQCKEEGIRIIRLGKGEILIGDLDFSLVVHFLQLSSFVITTGCHWYDQADLHYSV